MKKETASLTSRELDVLRLVAKGYTNKRIAATLEISAKTVEACLTRIYHKLKVSNRVQAATCFLLHRKALRAHAKADPHPQNPPPAQPGGKT